MGSLRWHDGVSRRRGTSRSPRDGVALANVFLGARYGYGGGNVHGGVSPGEKQRQEAAAAVAIRASGACSVTSPNKKLPSPRVLLAVRVSAVGGRTCGMTGQTGLFSLA